MMRYQFLLTIFLVLFGLSGIVLSAELHGKVTNSETLNPIQGATIKLISSDDSSADPISFASDKHGEFEIFYLPDGNYYLLTTHVAYDASDTLRLTLVDTSNIAITLIPSPWVLNEVVVTGTRSPHLLKDVPVQTEVVSQRDFHRTGATTVDEALTSSIGVQITETGFSGQSASLRGIEGDRVLILIDGQRAVGRVNGAIDLGQFSLTNVKKIEIVKGTGSTLYGSDAMGGVINIITKKPPRGATKLNVAGDYGTHTTYNPSASFDYGKTDWGVSFGAKLYSTAGFDLDPSTPHTRGVEDTDRLNINGSLRRKLSKKWNLNASARMMWENKKWIEYEEIDEYNKYSYDDDETNQRYDASLSFDYLSGDNYSMNFRLYSSWYDHEFNKFNESYWIDTSHTDDQYMEASYSSNYVIGDGHVATYGIDYNHQDLNAPSMADSKKANSTTSAYFQYEYGLIKQLNFLPGVRYENHSAFGGHWTPSINIMYSPVEPLKFRGFVGKGFRAPSIKQQYYIFDHRSAGYVIYGGEATIPQETIDKLTEPIKPFKPLVQENSINSSISVEFSYGTMGLHRLTYFYNHLDGLIIWDQIGTTWEYPRGIYVYQNIEKAITQGIEWESRIRLSQAVDFSFSYNYLNARDLSSGHDLINRPKHTVKLYLTGFHEASGFGLSVWGDYHSEKLWEARTNTGGNEGERGDEYAPGRSVFNANLFKRFGRRLEAYLRMQNIGGGTKFKYGYWPDREIYLGLKYNLIDN